MTFTKGHIPSEEMRRKMSESHKMQIPWNKGKKGLQIAWNKGKTGIYSEESRIKMRASHIGKKLSEETRAKMSGRIPWNKGKKPSEEAIKKQKESHRKTLSNPELRKIISQRISLANKGKPSWNKGIPMKEESRTKMSLAVKNAWSNPELRKRQSESHKGLHLSEKTEFKKGMVPWIKGKHFSEETMIKIRANRNTPEYRELAKERMLKQLAAGDFPNVENTKPERQIKEELIKRGYKEGIDFIHQYKFMNKFMCDFCFPNKKLIVEVDGDYWHVNPSKYLAPKNDIQKRALIKHKSKTAYITKVDDGSWTLLRFWESDIKRDVKKCVDKIQAILAN